MCHLFFTFLHFLPFQVLTCDLVTKLFLSRLFVTNVCSWALFTDKCLVKMTLIEKRKYECCKKEKNTKNYGVEKLTCLVHNCIPKNHCRDASDGDLLTGKAPQDLAERGSGRVCLSEGGHCPGRTWLAGLPASLPPSHCTCLLRGTDCNRGSAAVPRSPLLICQSSTSCDFSRLV